VVSYYLHVLEVLTLCDGHPEILRGMLLALVAIGGRSARWCIYSLFFLAVTV